MTCRYQEDKKLHHAGRMRERAGTHRQLGWNRLWRKARLSLDHCGKNKKTKLGAKIDM
jgi:hypothetical protein